MKHAAWKEAVAKEFRQTVDRLAVEWALRKALRVKPGQSLPDLTPVEKEAAKERARWWHEHGSTKIEDAFKDKKGG